MRLSFTKMHGNGNDFVVVEGARVPEGLTPETVRRLGDRRRGIGFDQMLVVDPPSSPDASDVDVRIWNSDGSRARHCGNGVRCVARFAVALGLAGPAVVRISTPGGPVRAEVGASGRVRVDMGRPRFEPAEIPFVASARAPRYSLRVGAEDHVVGAVSMGNPHAVLVVEDVDRAPVSALAPRIQSLDRFPEGVNVGFAQVLDPAHLRLRVYERGAGETPCCGTGACAAVAVARVQDLLATRVRVDLAGGSLEVEWDGDAGPVFMSGPAEWVYEGETTV